MVRFGASNSFLFGCLLANFRSSGFTNVCLNRGIVDQLSDDIFCFVIDSGSLESAINQGSGFSSIEGKELVWVSFNLLFGDFENGFGDLCFVILHSYQPA